LQAQRIVRRAGDAMVNLGNGEPGKLGDSGRHMAKKLLKRVIVALAMRCHFQPAKRVFTHMIRILGLKHV